MQDTSACTSATSSLAISPLDFPQSPFPTSIQHLVSVLTPHALRPWQSSRWINQPSHTRTYIDTHTQTLREVAKLQPASLISLVAPSRTLNHVIRKLIQSPKQDSRRQFLFIHLLRYLGVTEEEGMWFYFFYYGYIYRGS